MKNLSKELSKLKVFDNPKKSLEQYPTDPYIAANVLWEADMLGFVKGKRIVDLGAGTGILGIGALLLGASNVVFVEIDLSVVSILKSNIKKVDLEFELGNHSIIHSDVHKPGIFDRTFDLSILNPPFGTNDSGADIAFLELAFKLSGVVLSFHKTSTTNKIISVAKSKGFKVIRRNDFRYPLKNTMVQHTKNVEFIEVTCFLFKKS